MGCNGLWIGPYDRRAVTEDSDALKSTVICGCQFAQWPSTNFKAEREEGRWQKRRRSRAFMALFLHADRVQLISGCKTFLIFVVCE